MVRLPRTLSSKANSLLGSSFEVGYLIPSGRHPSALGSSTLSAYMVGRDTIYIRNPSLFGKLGVMNLVQSLWTVPIYCMSKRRCN